MKCFGDFGDVVVVEGVFGVVDYVVEVVGVNEEYFVGVFVFVFGEELDVDWDVCGLEELGGECDYVGD